MVGIVASRLAEEYSCPTFLICLDGDKGKASSRSYGGFNLFSSLEQVSDLLESYGGHELAAGFTIRRDRIDRFRERIYALTDAFSKSPGLQSGAADRLRDSAAAAHGAECAAARRARAVRRGLSASGTFHAQPDCQRSV